MAVLAAFGTTATNETDPAGGAYVPARPLGAWAAKVTGDAMPEGASAAAEWGRVGLLFTIAADGSIAECRVASGTPYPRLDAASCPWLTAHAHFAPATVAGEPVKSLAFETIDWGSPPVYPAPPSTVHEFFSSAVPLQPAPSTGPMRPDGPAILRGNAQLLISSDDYPDGSLRNAEEGSVAIVLDVTEAGRAEHCRIVQSSGFDRLDAATCMLFLRRARYWPALLHGKPVRGTADKNIRWTIPGRRAPVSSGVGAAQRDTILKDRKNKFSQFALTNKQQQGFANA